MPILQLHRGLDMSLLEAAPTSQRFPRQLAQGPSASVPLDQLPPWMFDSLGSTLNGSLWAMIAVSALFLGLRLYCKIAKQKGLWWDDYVLTASWVLLLANGITASIDVSLGLGQHIEVLGIKGANIPSLMEILSISSCIGILGAATSKTSFAVTLLRLTDGWMKKLVWAIIISMNTIMLANAILSFASCNPPQKLWNPTIPGTCWNPLAYSVFAGAYSGAMDIVLSLLPWKITWSLQMRRKEKLGVAFAMSLGVLAGAAAFVKSAKIVNVADADPTFAIPELIIWGGAEIAMTIIAASIPILRVLLREVRNSSPKNGLSRYGYDIDSQRGYAYGTQNGAVVSISGGQPKRMQMGRGDAKRNVATHKAIDLDDGSDKSILNAPIAPGRIVQTQEVNVEYLQRQPHAVTNMAGSSEGDVSEGYEMRRLS